MTYVVAAKLMVVAVFWIIFFPRGVIKVKKQFNVKNIIYGPNKRIMFVSFEMTHAFVNGRLYLVFVIKEIYELVTVKASSELINGITTLL